MNHRRNSWSNRPYSLLVECLEERTMLSTVQIFASGDTGQEQFAVRVDDQVVQQFSATEQQQVFAFQTPQSLSPGQIRIDFLNDAVDPSQNLDRNLTVDAIQIDGVTFQTEDASVFSTGTWRPEDGIEPGFGRGDTLHSNGYFQFGDNDQGSLVEILARGDEGTEQFNLFIRDSFAGTFNASPNLQLFSYQDSGQVSANDVRIEFINDRLDSANGFDANLFIDYIRIDGTTYQTESPNVFSTGTWRPEDGIVPGNGRGEYLHTNGYFEYGDSTGGGSTLEVVARGTEGGEQFNLLIDGTVARTFTVTTSNQTFIHEALIGVSADDVRIEFFNDRYDPANSIDTNLIVDLIRIDGTTFQTESNTVFSTGTYRSDGLANGFGRGETLHTSGYFDFGALETNTRYRVTFDASWSSQTHPNGAFAAGAHFSGLVGATHNGQVEFWSPGARASDGIEDVAELGSKTQFSSEVNSAIDQSVAENLLSGGGITASPDSVSLEFNASADYSLVTLISMLAPSPDWFVGVHGLSLIDSSGWISSEVISLAVYDAGTDDGTDFFSQDIDNPNGTISRITSGPLANNGSVAPVGTFRFERIG